MADLYDTPMQQAPAMGGAMPAAGPTMMVQQYDDARLLSMFDKIRRVTALGIKLMMAHGYTRIYEPTTVNKQSASLVACGCD